MQNPYEPPKAFVVEAGSPEAVATGKIYKRTVLPAFLTLNVFYLASAASGIWIGESRGFLYETCAFIGSSLTIAGILYLLEKMSDRVAANGAVRYLTIWGFVWRTLVTAMVAGVFAGLAAMAFGIDMVAAKSSALFALLSAIPVFLASTVVIWALFSNNRRLHLLEVSRWLGRG